MSKSILTAERSAVNRVALRRVSWTAEARSFYESLGTADLLAEVDRLHCERELYRDLAARQIVDDRIAIADSEVARRVQLAEAGKRVVHPARFEQWVAFARVLRETIDLVEYVDRWHATLQKTSADEFHGPCPLCGGVDRFWVRASWKRWFCRRCNPDGGDIITLYRSVHNAGFHQALEDLARLHGLPVPGEEVTP